MGGDLISLLLPPSGWQDCQPCCALSSDGCYRDSKGVSTTSPSKGLLVHRSMGPATSTVAMEKRIVKGSSEMQSNCGGGSHMADPSLPHLACTWPQS